MLNNLYMLLSVFFGFVAWLQLFFVLFYFIQKLFLLFLFVLVIAVEHHLDIYLLHFLSWNFTAGLDSPETSVLLDYFFFFNRKSVYQFFS